MRPHADAGSVVVRAELSPELVAARANPEQLQRVLFNLIQNAIRHTPADGSVVVRAAPATGDAIEIEVADSGPGIARDERDRVFDPFFQGGDRSARSDAGAGLGLGDLPRDHRGPRRPDLARRRRARDDRAVPHPPPCRLARRRGSPSAGASTGRTCLKRRKARTSGPSLDAPKRTRTSTGESPPQGPQPQWAPSRCVPSVTYIHGVAVLEMDATRWTHEGEAVVTKVSRGWCHRVSGPMPPGVATTQPN